MIYTRDKFVTSDIMGFTDVIRICLKWLNRIHKTVDGEFHGEPRRSQKFKQKGHAYEIGKIKGKVI